MFRYVLVLVSGLGAPNHIYFYELGACDAVAAAYTDLGFKLVKCMPLQVPETIEPKRKPK